MQDAPERTLIELIRYNVWANLRVLEACQSLTADQRLRHPATGSLIVPRSVSGSSAPGRSGMAAARPTRTAQTL